LKGPKGNNGLVNGRKELTGGSSEWTEK